MATWEVVKSLDVLLFFTVFCQGKLCSVLCSSLAIILIDVTVLPV